MSLKFRGSQNLRLRLVCATLSGKSIRIDGIRERDQAPGLRDYEACLLRLLEKVTDGCTVEINETGNPPACDVTRRSASMCPLTTSWGARPWEASSYPTVHSAVIRTMPYTTTVHLAAKEHGARTQGRACGTCRGSSRAAAASATTAGGAGRLATSWSRLSAWRCLGRRSAPHSLCSVSHRRVQAIHVLAAAGMHAEGWALGQPGARAPADHARAPACNRWRDAGECNNPETAEERPVVRAQPLSITLSGITSDSTDPGVDLWRSVTFPLIRRAPALSAPCCCSIEFALEPTAEVAQFWQRDVLPL